MTISASDEAADSARLGRSLELYSDLAVALRGQIDQLKAAVDGNLEGKIAEDAFKLFRQALWVAETEASLAKRSRAGGGAGGRLDLDAARAEILARLAVWAAAS
jgi:hypothetical protein